MCMGCREVNELSTKPRLRPVGQRHVKKAVEISQSEKSYTKVFS